MSKSEENITDIQMLDTGMFFSLELLKVEAERHFNSFI
jgi:hypothetical protein